MKRILALTFCLGLGLATVAHADDKDKKHAKKAAAATAAGQRNAVRAARQNANYQRSVQHSARIQQKTFAHQNQNALRIQNRRARHDYELGDSLVVGLELTGAETKSLRMGHGHLRGAYVTVKGDELYLINATITGSSGLNKEDIDRMVTDAEQNAE